MRSERVRIIVEIALAIALAAVLNTLKIWRMPNAGTVSFVMLPLIVLALRRGLLVGVVAGALYGFADFFIDPFPPVHWLQPLLDYPIAYAMVGLSALAAVMWRRAYRQGRAGMASLATVLACVIASALRYAVHVLSGVIYFAEFAPPGQPVLVYSSIYNLYVPVSGGLALVAALAIMPILERAVPTQGRNEHMLAESL